MRPRIISPATDSVDKSIGGLPVFLEPSSTELSSLLATINAKVLLPEHLSKEQQQLVYKQKSRAKLETEPVEVTLGDVTLPLEHIDRNLRPGRWQSLKSVVDQSETTADWENVVRVVEGFHSAGITIKPEWQELVVRTLLREGHHNIVLKALQRVKATGIRLSNYNVTMRVLKGAHERASESDWEKAETVKSLRYTRQIVELMEEEEHHSVLSKGAKMAQTDWRGKPFVVAVPTELAAVVAQKHGGDVETVKALANRLVHALKQDNFTVSCVQSVYRMRMPLLTQVQDTLDSVSASSAKAEADYKSLKSQTDAINQHCQGLFELLVIWNALNTSRTVLGAEMPLATEAAEFEDKTKTVLRGGVEVIPKLRNRDGVEVRSMYPRYLTEQMQKCGA